MVWLGFNEYKATQPAVGALEDKAVTVPTPRGVDSDTAVHVWPPVRVGPRVGIDEEAIAA